jgi:hypothetical protein
MMEAATTFETLVNFYQTTRRYRDDGGSKDLWNAGKLLPAYTVLPDDGGSKYL